MFCLGCCAWFVVGGFVLVLLVRLGVVWVVVGLLCWGVVLLCGLCWFLCWVVLLIGLGGCGGFCFGVFVVLFFWGCCLWFCGFVVLVLGLWVWLVLGWCVLVLGWGWVGWCGGLGWWLVGSGVC
ncbi:hypothetical protein, partial [Pseudomonas syringae group genomosp. 7]|uniref:hypothetical protein n=1 Tax=Pseudomonas syringae group genomosp. 7 TaxID=251699 RepID=UPI0037705A8D